MAKTAGSPRLLGTARRGGSGAGRGRFSPDRADVPAAVGAAARPGDLVLTMGAGDVTALGPQIVAALAAKGLDG